MEQKKQISDIEELIALKEQEQYSLEENQDTLYDNLELGINKLQILKDEIKNDGIQFTKEQKETSGVVFFLSNNGELEIKKGLQRAEDKIEKITENGDVPLEKGNKSDFTKALIESLTSRKTEIIQHEISKNPEYAFDLTVAIFVAKTLSATSQFQIMTKVCHGNFELETEPQTMVKLVSLEEEIMKDFQALEDPDFSMIFETVRKLSKDDKMKLIAFHVASSFNDISSIETAEPFTKVILDDLNVNVLDHWTPTAENCFSKISKSKLVELVAENSKFSIAELTKKKRTILAKLAETHCSKYLPSVMIK